MKIHWLRMQSFRAHTDTRLEFAPKLNLIYGPNGAGKTNILEAVHYLCLTKGFLTNTDLHALQKNAPFFQLTGAFGGTHRRAVEIRLTFDRRRRKQIFSNGARIERRADLVGMLPVVAFAPSDIAITAGAPTERRRFVNNILSQERPAYLTTLLRYRRVLSQRNRMLDQARRKRETPNAAMLDSWNASLVNLGSLLIKARSRFLADFAGFVTKAYQLLNAVTEEPAMTYKCAIAPPDAVDSQDQLHDLFHERLASRAQREQKVGRTLVGPHLDDIHLSIDGLALRDYGSQGQHRTFGIAIKLAQYQYLNSRLEESPILLLDDVFDSLDAKRARAILALLQSDELGQTLITAAEKQAISRFVPFAFEEHRCIQIRDGAEAANGQ